MDGASGDLELNASGRPKRAATKKPKRYDDGDEEWTRSGSEDDKPRRPGRGGRAGAGGAGGGSGAHGRVGTAASSPAGVPYTGRGWSKLAPTMLRNIVSFIKDADHLLALALSCKAALAAVKALPNWQGQLLWDADLLESVRSMHSPPRPHSTTPRSVCHALHPMALL